MYLKCILLFTYLMEIFIHVIFHSWDEVNELLFEEIVLQPFCITNIKGFSCAIKRKLLNKN